MTKSIAVDFAPVDGAMVFVAQSDEYAGSNASTDQVTYGGTYTAGAVTAGIQMTSIDKSAVNTDQDRTHIAASFAVNDNLSVSVTQMDNEFDKASGTNVTEETSGVGISYTMGSASVRMLRAETDNLGGVSTAKSVEHTEISLLLAF